MSLAQSKSQRHGPKLSDLFHHSVRPKVWQKTGPQEALSGGAAASVARRHHKSATAQSRLTDVTGGLGGYLKSSDLEPQCFSIVTHPCHCALQVLQDMSLAQSKSQRHGPKLSDLFHHSVRPKVWQKTGPQEALSGGAAASVAHTQQLHCPPPHLVERLRMPISEPEPP